MRNLEELEQYFRGLEARDEFSGVVLMTRGAAKLYRDKDGGLLASVRRQGAELSARPGLSLLQLRLCAARPGH